MNLSQVEHRPFTSSQTEKVLAELESKPGQWISLPRLGEVSGSLVVHSRIANLRDRGHRIENKVEYIRYGAVRVCKSFYRLVPATEVA